MAAIKSCLMGDSNRRLERASTPTAAGVIGSMLLGRRSLVGAIDSATPLLLAL
jgi:hypothetical protein